LAPQKIDFEGALHTRGAYFYAFHTNGQIGHTRGAPRSLNPSLPVSFQFVQLLLCNQHG